MASWHNRKFGYQPPLPTGMWMVEPFRRAFFREEWKGGGQFYKRREFRAQREFRSGQWRRCHIPPGPMWAPQPEGT